jgi:uncharacterized protein with HEPN domain
MRPEEGDAARLWDMADFARKILDTLKGVHFEDWIADQNLRDLVVFRMTLLGEAANHLSRAFRAKHPEVPWRTLVDQRNALIHGCIEIDYEELWRTVQGTLPDLLHQLESLMPPIPSPMPEE